MTVPEILGTGYNKELAGHIIKAFKEIQNNYILKKWKPSELDSGHFVEAVRRTLDFVLTGLYTPFKKKLADFNDAELRRYENLVGHDSYRMLIPRALKAIYNIRSKRGVAHISDIDPNEMDATFILYSAKWVLAELIRMKSQMNPGQTQQMVDEIMERHIPIIWEKDGNEIVLVPGMLAREQALILLYKRSPRKVDELRRVIEYKNLTQFKTIIRVLHRRDKLVYLAQDGNCHITPLGIIEAECIMAAHKSA